MSLCDCLLSPSMPIMKVNCGSIPQYLFIFFNFYVLCPTPVNVHLLVDGYLGSFHFLAILNNIAVSMSTLSYRHSFLFLL